jgi:Protein of unknown function (DUF2795)
MSGEQVDECFRRMTVVLADVKFPAMKWELLIHAEFVGADIRSRTEIYRLPAGSYEDMAAVIWMINHSVEGDDQDP